MQTAVNIINELMHTILSIVALLLSIKTIDSISSWLSQWNSLEKSFQNEECQKNIRYSFQFYILISLIYWSFQGWLFSETNMSLWFWSIVLLAVALFALFPLLNQKIAIVLGFIWTLIVTIYWLANFNSSELNTDWLSWINISISIPKQYGIVPFFFGCAWVLFSLPQFIVLLVIGSFNTVERDREEINKLENKGFLKTIFSFLIIGYLSLSLEAIISLIF